MIDIEDRDFFDLLYAQWAKTTGAESQFWMTEEVGPVFPSFFPSFFPAEEDDVFTAIYAVNEKQERTPLGVFSSEADADFVTAVHGCLADLVRRLHEALDEADRLDAARDDQAALTAELALEVEDLRASRDARECRIAELEDEVTVLKMDLESVTGAARAWGAPV